MVRAFFLGFSTVIVGLGLAGCDGEPLAKHTSPKWLEECVTNADCGSTGSCLCGRCTVACTDSCDDGPAGTACTRTSGCGTVESGACVSRCVRTSDCADGLACSGGLCAASTGDETDGGAPADALPGVLHPGTDGAWARTLRGYYSTPPGWTARDLSLGGPSLALAPGGDVVALLSSEIVLTRDAETRYLTEVWLARLDGGTGTVEWVESVRTNAGMAVDASGNIVLASPTLLQKLDPDGNLLWTEKREPLLPDETVSVAVDGSGNILTARRALTERPGKIGGDPKGVIELRKLDPAGGEVFSRTIGEGVGLLEDQSVTVDASDNVLLLVGRVEADADFGGGVLQGFNVLAKYDPSGRPLFSKALGGHPSDLAYHPVQTTADGRIFCSSSSIGPVDIGLGELECTYYLFELDASGAPLSNRCVLLDDYAVLPEGGFATAWGVFDPVTIGDEMCMPASSYLDGALIARYDDDFGLVGHYCNSDLGVVPGEVLPASPGYLFISGAGGGKVPGGIELTEGGPLVAKIPVP